jgi:hypothetical protein
MYIFASFLFPSFFFDNEYSVYQKFGEKCTKILNSTLIVLLPTPNI